jgi:hypothetical protein
MGEIIVHLVFVDQVVTVGSCRVNSVHKIPAKNPAKASGAIARSHANFCLMLALLTNIGVI